MTLFIIKELITDHQTKPSQPKPTHIHQNIRKTLFRTQIQLQEFHPPSSDLIVLLNKRLVYVLPLVQQLHILIMTTTISELYGIDVSDYGVVALNRQTFKSVDFDLYPPERTHFLIHAVQFQRTLPTEKNMLKAEKANEKKCKKEDRDQAARPTIVDPRRNRRIFRNFQRRRFSWVVPDKFGPQPVKREGNDRGRGGRRYRGGRNFGPSPTLSNYLGTLPNMMNWIPNTIPQMGLPSVLPGTLPQFPGVMPQLSGVGLANQMLMNGSIPMLGQQMPIVGQPIPMLGQQMPMNLGQIPPIGLPSPIIPQQQVALPTYSIVPATIPGQTPRKQRQPRLPKKPVTTAFKVKSPEQIVLKAARRQCQQNFQKWRDEYKITRQVYATTVVTPIPIYFQKKKASQKRRRQEKYQLIKQNKIRLVEIYGTAVFSRGWPITRKEILASLGLTDQNQAPFEEVAAFMEMTTSEQNDEQLAQEQLPLSFSESDFPEMNPAQHQTSLPVKAVQSV